MNYQKILVWLLVLSSFQCTYDLPESPPAPSWNPGTSDLQRIVVLGGSVGAGVMDGALYTQSQENSIGNLLTTQINSLNPNPLLFQQPDINDTNGYNLQAPGTEILGKSFLKFVSPGSVQLFKEFLPGTLPVDYSGPSLNNFSVPYLRTSQVADNTLSDNPFYARFTPSATATLIDQVVAADPSLVILQLGWDDILPYVQHGLTGAVSPDPDNIGPQDLTPINLFQQNLDLAVQQIIDNTSADVIISNIPDLSQFPFFNSISEVARIDGAEATFLSGFWRDYNLQVTRSNANADVLRPIIIFFSDDPPHLWKAIVEDPALTTVILDDGSELPKYRQMEEGEYILWSAPALPSLEGDRFGTEQPIPKSLFFTKQDIEDTRDLVDQYNQVISDLAQSQSRVTLMDWRTTTDNWIEEGVLFEGVLYTYDFRRSGIFSSDGVTYNQRGSALMANRIIDLINQQYGANIPRVDVNNLPGNIFVNDF